MPNKGEDSLNGLLKAQWDAKLSLLYCHAISSYIIGYSEKCMQKFSDASAFITSTRRS